MFTVRFQPDRGFSGADADQSREGPVQFEKAVEEDPFGLNKFLTEAKKAKRPSEDSRWELYLRFSMNHVFFFFYRAPGLSKAKRPKY